MSIIITIISNITLLMSQNGCFMPVSHVSGQTDVGNEDLR